MPENTTLYNTLALFVIIVLSQFNVNMLLTNMAKYLYSYLSFYGETGREAFISCLERGVTRRDGKRPLPASTIVAPGAYAPVRGEQVMRSR